MSYLDWKGTSVLPLHQPQSPSRSVLTLTLTPVLLQELAADIGDAYTVGGTELRVALPQQWLLFWKVRDEGNRILLAHPSENEWVATCALEKEFAAQLVLSLKNLAQGQSLSLSQLSSERNSMHSVSNLDLVFVLKGSD